MTTAEWKTLSAPIIVAKLKLWDKAENDGLTDDEKRTLAALDIEDSRLLSEMLGTRENWTPEWMG